MKINAIMQGIREATPPEVSKQVDLSVAISNRIYELLEKKGMTQKDLAQALHKTETEVSRWLSGTHNMTLATIAKIACVMGDDIVCATHDAMLRPYDLEQDENNTNRVADVSLN